MGHPGPVPDNTAGLVVFSQWARSDSSNTPWTLMYVQNQEIRTGGSGKRWERSHEDSPMSRVAVNTPKYNCYSTKG